ncbi:hypothetical protein [Streptomyces sp. NPDC006309]
MVMKKIGEVGGFANSMISLDDKSDAEVAQALGFANDWATRAGSS